MPYRDLNVLDAAERAAAQVDDLLKAKHSRLMYASQIRDSAGGVPANIAEGFGRLTKADRDYKLIVARGEAEETITRLRVNFAARRITRSEYFPIANLLQTVVKMLNALISRIER